MAFASGLPVKHFIAACNANDVVTNYLQTEKYTPKQAIATVSNAMDVGNPSNFVRIQQIFKNEFSLLKNKLSSISVSDEITKRTIAKVYENHNYILDPHGAVAYYALEKTKGNGYILETAHPVKFPDVVEEAIGKKIEVPEEVKYLFSQTKKSILLSSNYNHFKEWLMNK